jgi:hypothetical protein
MPANIIKIKRLQIKLPRAEQARVDACDTGVMALTVVNAALHGRDQK